MNNEECIHSTSGNDKYSTFSGNLICTRCGQVIQDNSQLSLDAPFKPITTFNNTSTTNQHPRHHYTPHLSHQERSELALSALARKLIDALALKASYQDEAAQLMQRYWNSQSQPVKQRYGLAGNRLLAACLFLLARRDHLAVNLAVLAEAVDSSAAECGSLFDPLVKLEPSLRVLAKVADFSEKCLNRLLLELKQSFALIILEQHTHNLRLQADFLANLLQNDETGGSKSAESTALAAAWIVTDALIQESKIPESPAALAAIESAIGTLCEASKLSLTTVKSKRNILFDLLLERAKILLPGTFTTSSLSKKQLKILLLDNLSSLSTFT